MNRYNFDCSLRFGQVISTLAVLTVSLILLDSTTAAIAATPADSYLVLTNSAPSPSSEGGPSPSLGVVKEYDDDSRGDLLFTSLTAVEPTSPATSVTIKLLPGSLPQFFKCNETPFEGSPTLPGTTDIASSSNISVTDRDANTEILGKAIFDVTFTPPVLNNPGSPDIIVSEIGDTPESFKVAALDKNDGSVSGFKEYSGSPTGTSDSCGYEIFETRIDLSDFGVTEGDSISTLRIDNNGQPGCCVGADIGDIWVVSGGGGGSDSTITEATTAQETAPAMTSVPEPTPPTESEQAQPEPQIQQREQQMQLQTAQTQSINQQPGGLKVYNLIVGDKTYPITYTILGGAIANIVANSIGLAVNFDPSAAVSPTGILLTIDLPRDLIDSTDVQQGGVDKAFIVLSGNGQVIDTVMETEKNTTSRKLVISFNNNNNAGSTGSLQIQGTKIALPPSILPSPGSTTPQLPPTIIVNPPSGPGPSGRDVPTTPPGGGGGTTPPAPPPGGGGGTTPNTPTTPAQDSVDTDKDGVSDSKDNCINAANPDQKDFDQDGEGDDCEDTDNDGIANTKDNCVNDSNPDQKDTDGDSSQGGDFDGGDACDPDAVDSDKDTVVDSKDNCPSTPNPKQEDTDGDKQGDACDTDLIDSDKDTVLDSKDNCPGLPNPKQEDTDKDGTGDECDRDQIDSDKDGVADSKDNCPGNPNPKQEDTDKDEIGDICDPDQIDNDNDGVPSSKDNCVYNPNPKQEDADKDGVGDACDSPPVGNAPAAAPAEVDQTDLDGDGIVDTEDNCPEIVNVDQLDTDADNVGDACDEAQEPTSVLPEDQDQGEEQEPPQEQPEPELEQQDAAEPEQQDEDQGTDESQEN